MARKNSKKKIAVFIPEFPVITETFIQRDLVKLVELGKVDLVVLCIRRGSGDIDPALKHLVHKVRLNVIDMFFALRYLFTEKEEVRQIRHILKGDLTRNFIKKCYLLLKALGYTNIIKNYKPNELHIHFYSDFSTIGMFVALLMKIPFSISAHARDVFEYPHLPKSKANLAKFVTVCNKQAYERLVQISDAPPEKVHLIHHGIDPEKVFPTDTAAHKPDAPMIFMGGTRLTEKKGIEYMLEASKILKNRGIKHRVDLVGVGPKHSHYSEKIAEMGLKDIFIIHGGGKGLPFSEVAKYYLAADLFVLPIVKTAAGDSDGIPNAVIEAAMAKLPIITTDAGSVNELIINDVTGVVVPQKNPEVLATEIEKLLIDEERKSRLGEAAYYKAVDMFDQERNVKELNRLLLQ